MTAGGSCPQRSSSAAQRADSAGRPIRRSRMASWVLVSGFPGRWVGNSQGALCTLVFTTVALS